MLDPYTIDYIIDYYGSFMTLLEAAANKHYITQMKFKDGINDDSWRSRMIQKGWLSENKEVLKLLENGYQDFRLRTAERIFVNHKDEIYFNYCPKCKRIARTPQAKQCRFCYYSWHNIVVATFQIASVLELSDHRFFILGDLLTGRIKIGNKADLTSLGMSVKPEIIAIEFALHRSEEDGWEDTGLNIQGLSESEKEFLKAHSPFLTPILIEDENIV